MHLTDKYFANPATLPSMPEVAHRLLRSFNDDRVGLHEIADLVGQDQGMAVKLLRMANSARYSPRHTIVTLKDAAATIGLTSLRDLSLAACMVGAFPKTAGFDRLRFWRQCLANAGNARTLAQACGLDADVAHIAGLLMRTGELLMLMTDPDAIALAERQSTMPDSLLEHEHALLACTHLDVTAELARRWHLPTELSSAIAAAADPLAVRPFNRLGGVLRLASVMSDAGDRGLPAITTLLEVQPELVEHLHLDLDWLAHHLMPWDLLTQGVDQLLH
jgi:HD-like signal output (HDOD) protein